jgi:signal peptidase I
MKLRVARLLASAVTWACLGLIVGAALAAGAPRLFGLTSLTVLSGSMQPTIDTGDLIVGRPIPAESARIGDVITFREPGTERLVTHRVRDMQLSGRGIRLATKGDANNAPERWTITSGGTVSRVLYRLPKLGYVRSWMGGRFGRLIFIVIPVALLAALALLRIWRPTHDPTPRVAHVS